MFCCSLLLPRPVLCRMFTSASDAGTERRNSSTVPPPRNLQSFHHGSFFSTSLFLVDVVFAWYVIALDRSNFQGGLLKNSSVSVERGSPPSPERTPPPPHRIGQTSKIAPNTCWFSRPRKITVLIICLVRRSTMTVGRRPAIFLARGLKKLL